MPDQNMPTHVVAGMIRAQLGNRLWFVFDQAMDPQVAAQRVPDPVFVTTAHIPSRRFMVNTDGMAMVVPRRDFSVFGIIFEVADVALAALDVQLGVPHDWHRYGCLGRDPGQRPILMEFHTPAQRRPSRLGQADPSYMRPIVEAARKWGFPQEYLDQFRFWCSDI
jgi:hypothetical protein